SASWRSSSQSLSWCSSGSGTYSVGFSFEHTRSRTVDNRHGLTATPITLAFAMPVPAVFGISNSGVNLAIDLLILFLVVIWLALVYWTYADARRRIADPMLVGCATAAALFPYAGTLVYMIVRP